MNFQSAVGKVVGYLNLNQMVVDFFALDIGTTAVRVIQLSQKSPTEWQLLKYAVTPVDERIVESDAPADQRHLGEAILATIKAANITTKNVAMGIPSGKIFSTIIEVPDVPKQELPTAISYQAENYIPTQPEESKIDWALLGPSLADKTKLEALIASASNDYLERQMAFLENLGLNVIAFEPDTIALTRALLPRNIASNHIIIDCGAHATDILVTVGDNPRMIRSLSFGMLSFIKAVMTKLNVTREEAEQYLLKFGFNQQALDGQLFGAISGIIEQFAVEFEKTIKYLRDKYPDLAIDSSLLSGYAVLLPGFADLVVAKIGGQVNIATPWQNVVVPPEHQEQIAPVSAQLAVAVGLAEREAH
jgi:type IV pilus assembly protein PilM